uniref:Uncharacterized protein n=1 Tax=viral metagenome TaxID=1070528 RepID=A0A6M3JY83_9ZZZZ
MNFSTLKTRTLQKLNESTSSPNFWSLVEIGDFLNEGYSDLASITKIIETSATLSLVANQYIYSLDSSCLKINRMYYETDDRIIKPATWADINKQDRWWNETSFDYPKFWVPISTQKIFLWPKPIENESSCITYYFSSLSTDMSDDNDTPAGPDVFHSALIDFACAMALLRKRNSEAMAKSKYFYEQYKEKRVKITNHKANRANRTPRVRTWA